MAITFQTTEFTYANESPSILKGLSVSFDRSKINLLTGASGCGKSTLLYLAAGIYPNTCGVMKQGSVTVEELSPSELPPQERCKLVGMMFQNPELQFCMDTVQNELAFCLENIQTPSDVIQKLIDKALEFCEITHLKNRTLLSLSGGERQKVMLACITALKPKWLLLDEPFANIDTESAKSIAKKLGELHKVFGTGILAVDHRLENWIEVAEEIWVMQNGVIKDSISMNQIDPKEFEQLGIIVPNTPYLSSKQPKRPLQAPILELKDLCVSHSENKILDHLNASFGQGQVHAILGESGCGKSSLFGAIFGVHSYKGNIILEGKNLKTYKKGLPIGLVTQSPQDQFISGTVYSEIDIGVKKHKQKGSKSTEAILREIGLWRYRDCSPYMLSQGQQRKLGVSALLAYDCHVLLCDEPTYAQDRRNTLAIMNALLEKVNEHHLTLIFSTHDEQLAKDYADVIWKMKGGQLNAVTESNV